MSQQDKAFSALKAQKASSQAMYAKGSKSSLSRKSGLPSPRVASSPLIKY
jgi:hypothetical protein